MKIDLYIRLWWMRIIYMRAGAVCLWYRWWTRSAKSDNDWTVNGGNENEIEREKNVEIVSIRFDIYRRRHRQAQIEANKERKTGSRTTEMERGRPSKAVAWYSLHGWRRCCGWWRQAWCLRIALGSRHRSILKQIVRLPEQVLAVVLKALVQQSQQENGYHGTNKTRHRLDVPPGEQNCLIVAKVELQKAQQRVIKETKVQGRGESTYRHWHHVLHAGACATAAMLMHVMHAHDQILVRRHQRRTKRRRVQVGHVFVIVMHGRMIVIVHGMVCQSC